MMDDSVIELPEAAATHFEQAFRAMQVQQGATLSEMRAAAARREAELLETNRALTADNDLLRRQVEVLKEELGRLQR